MDQLNSIYRRRWEEQRAKLEKGPYRRFPLRESPKIPLRDPIGVLIKIFGLLLRLLGLFSWGNRQAKDLKTTENFIKSPKVPSETLKILHLSDIHLDECPVEIEKLIWAIKECGEYHLVVITGDLLSGWPIKKKEEEKLDLLITSLKPIKEILMVLGNHDSMKMVPYLESKGIRVLTNQIKLYHKTDSVPFAFEVLGTDDPHYFFQRDALRILQEGQPERLRIALIHTPELYDFAAKNDIDVYLCGHTHAGQIALPGGFPPLRRVYRGKKFVKGPWEFGKMKGYTSAGVGTSGLPVRFFTRPEITIHHIGGMKS